MIAKTCFKCGETKPLDEFYRHPQMADGHLGKCKECTKRDVRRRYQIAIDERREYERKRAQDPDRKLKVLQYQRYRRSRDPQRESARRAVAYHVRAGYLIRPGRCERCGAECKPQAHHFDYSHKLDVEWLCFACHRALHGQVTAAGGGPTQLPMI